MLVVQTTPRLDPDHRQTVVDHIPAFDHISAFDHVPVFDLTTVLRYHAQTEVGTSFVESAPILSYDGAPAS